MGNKNLKLTKLALALGLTVGLTGCFSDNDNDVTVTPPDPGNGTVTVPSPDTPPALSSYISLIVTDNANDNVVSSSISFLADGEAFTGVTDLDGTAITELSSETGSFTFKVADGVTADDFVVVVNADNYIQNSAVVDLSSDEDVIDVAVKLISAEGVVTTVTGTSTGGKLAEEVKSDNLTISTDVELQDADGNPVSGAVSIAIASADTGEGDVSAADLIPAGLNNGTAGAGQVLVPAAVVTVNIDAGGTAVKKLSEAVTLTANIASDFKDGLAAGDSFDVFTYNEVTGEWSDLGSDATLGALSGTSFPATFETSNFSSFVPVESVAACSTPVSFAFTGTAVPASGLNLSIASNSLRINQKIKQSNGTLFTADAAQKAGITATSTVDIVVQDDNGNSWGSASAVELCGEITLELAPQVTYTDQTFALTYSCSNSDTPDTTLDFTGALVRYNQAGKAPLIAAETSAGTYSLTGLENDATYQISVIPVGVDVGNASLTVADFVAGGDNPSFNVARDNCTVQTVTGSGS
ncbi:hypothetical protein [Pseudoalteromonas luteoviolacea]|uniref:Bacterial Ig-like domain-containing protein n=1 Tax=Pseudoalteromonas luteoviolacea S4054 TaxID=1129367 RepID=A0A0F6ACK9_9GAMM|nr:hypothetical protein [Pseudoalteromonas luteoviolacea]AOT09684.1 hypothetical protein S4054249_18480 [Pseudoalteromonas luteoviolacea]AOT14597.1 hypothetical protein S40542_18450 [Pseudoalteromonas luteoviolacea]AOT19511.1 hypothetical protein S4054_18455 [Pseudoalteromonas luteoviolacea]KKE83952.1 hypothetical protein N479_11105 [Pseudoalteromonas luteoviolacea S4054]KZN77346.1 hypothetical protein N481_04645 [Pseudoalteromonas luteoviolacea S4047-1]